MTTIEGISFKEAIKITEKYELYINELKSYIFKTRYKDVQKIKEKYKILLIKYNNLNNKLDELNMIKKELRKIENLFDIFYCLYSEKRRSIKNEN